MLCGSFPSHSACVSWRRTSNWWGLEVNHQSSGMGPGSTSLGMMFLVCSVHAEAGDARRSEGCVLMRVLHRAELSWELHTDIPIGRGWKNVLAECGIMLRTGNFPAPANWRRPGSGISSSGSEAWAVTHSNCRSQTMSQRAGFTVWLPRPSWPTTTWSSYCYWVTGFEPFPCWRCSMTRRVWPRARRPQRFGLATSQRPLVGRLRSDGRNRPYQWPARCLRVFRGVVPLRWGGGYRGVVSVVGDR